MKGKILCPAGCQNPATRITEAKEILKNPRPAGSWRPLKCIFSGKEKRPPIASRKPCPVRSMYGKNRQGQSAAVLEQDSTAVPKFAYRSFCPCGNLVGECLPQTLLCGLRRLSPPRSCGKKGGHDHAKEIQHAPLQLRCENPAVRR